MMPGMGGTLRFLPLSSGTLSVKPTTCRLGTCVWNCNVSGMIVSSLGNFGTSAGASPILSIEMSCGASGVGSTTGNEIGTGFDAPTANEAVKL